MSSFPVSIFCSFSSVIYPSFCRKVWEKGNLKIVFENEKKEINHEVESNKIGLKSVKKIIEIHQGQCFIQDLMDSFILIITFPCHL